MGKRDAKWTFFNDRLRDEMNGIRPGRLLMSARKAVTEYADIIEDARSKGATWKELSEAFEKAYIKASPKTLSNLYSSLAKGRTLPATRKQGRPRKLLRPTSVSENIENFGVDRESVIQALIPLARSAREKGATKTEIAMLFRAAGVSCHRQSFAAI